MGSSFRRVTMALKPYGRVALLGVAVLTIIVIFAVGFPARERASKRHGISLPATGVWNGFQRQLNVVECSNLKDERASVNLTVSDYRGQVVGEARLDISPYGTQHVVLNQYPGIVDNYGTYRLAAVSGSAPVLSCYTVFYRSKPDGDSEKLEYAFCSPVSEALRGTSYGVFNSMNPDPANPLPVFNWLSIVNPSQDSFSGQIEVYDNQGSLQEQIAVTDLASGDRRDFALGHPSGQTTGQYRIIPDRPDMRYSAFVSRYSRKSAEEFNFGFVLQAAKPFSRSAPVPASSMGPAINWAEIANVSDSLRDVTLEVYSRNRELLHSEAVSIAPHSLHHVYLNQHIGEENVGFFSVLAADGDADGALLVSSLFYGRSPEGSEIGWAYASQAEGISQGAESARKGEIVFPVNTFKDAANWLKLFNAGTAAIPLDIALYGADGAELATRFAAVELNGSLDLPVHEETGPDFVGLIVVSPRNALAPYTAEMIRVVGVEAPARTASGSSLLRGTTRGGSSTVGLILNVPPVQASGSSALCGGLPNSAERKQCCEQIRRTKTAECAGTQCRTMTLPCQQATDYTSCLFTQRDSCMLRCKGVSSCIKQCNTCFSLASSCYQQGQTDYNTCVTQVVTTTTSRTTTRPSTVSSTTSHGSTSTILPCAIVSPTSHRVITAAAGSSVRVSADYRVVSGTACGSLLISWYRRLAGAGQQWVLVKEQHNAPSVGPTYYDINPVTQALDQSQYWVRFINAKASLSIMPVATLSVSGFSTISTSVFPNCAPSFIPDLEIVKPAVSAPDKAVAEYAPVVLSAGLRERSPFCPPVTFVWKKYANGSSLPITVYGETRQSLFFVASLADNLTRYSLTASVAGYSPITSRILTLLVKTSACNSLSGAARMQCCNQPEKVCDDEFDAKSLVCVGKPACPRDSCCRCYGDCLPQCLTDFRESCKASAKREWEVCLDSAALSYQQCMDGSPVPFESTTTTTTVMPVETWTLSPCQDGVTDFWEVQCNPLAASVAGQTAAGLAGGPQASAGGPTVRPVPLPCEPGFDQDGDGWVTMCVEE